MNGQVYSHWFICLFFINRKLVLFEKCPKRSIPNPQKQSRSTQKVSETVESNPAKGSSDTSTKSLPPFYFLAARHLDIRQFEKTTMASSISGSMRALALAKYCKPSGFNIATVPTPTISEPDEVLIKVYSASVNPVDVKLASGFGKMIDPKAAYAPSLAPVLCCYTSAR